MIGVLNVLGDNHVYKNMKKHVDCKKKHGRDGRYFSQRSYQIRKNVDCGAYFEN